MTTSCVGPQSRRKKPLQTPFKVGGSKLTNLFKLKFRFEEAEKAYETALHYINRGTNPRLWAETEVDVGYHSR
jgi:hypothetical protein